MTKRKTNKLCRFSIIIILAAIILSLLCFNVIFTGNKVAKNEHKNITNIHPIVFFDDQLFYNAVNYNPPNNNFIIDNFIKGGIIPHHILASNIIADFYYGLSSQDIETIILLGPNHEEGGDFVALSSKYSWQTPFGLVVSDEKIINDLLKNNLLKINNNILENEHSVAVHMPFIKYYLPDAKVAPIILSHKANLKNIKILSEQLEKYLQNNKTIVISSVDFSHYLTGEEAEQKDKESLEAMQNFDYKKIYSFNNDNLDSPPSIIALLMVMQKLKIDNFNVIANTNSGQLLNDYDSKTTSYFSIEFTK